MLKIYYKSRCLQKLHGTLTIYNTWFHDKDIQGTQALQDLQVTRNYFLSWTYNLKIWLI